MGSLGHFIAEKRRKVDAEEEEGEEALSQPRAAAAKMKIYN